MALEWSQIATLDPWARKFLKDIAQGMGIDLVITSNELITDPCPLPEDKEKILEYLVQGMVSRRKELKKTLEEMRPKFIFSRSSANLFILGCYVLMVVLATLLLWWVDPSSAIKVGLIFAGIMALPCGMALYDLNLK